MQKEIEDFIKALDEKVQVIIYRDDNSYKITLDTIFENKDLLLELEKDGLILKKLSETGLIHATFQGFPYLIEAKNIECEKELVFQ